MKRTIATVYALALVGLTACGQKDAPATTQAAGMTAPSSGADANGNCGEQVARDYQQMSFLCRMPRDRGEAFRCEEAAEDFLHRYPSVSCNVMERELDGDVRLRHIDARESREILERLRRTGFDGDHDGR